MTADLSPARKGFFFAVTVTCFWGLLLAGLVIFSANLVTLNRRQLREADVVITAKIIDAQQGTVVIEKIWWSKSSSRPLLKSTATITIAELQKSSVVNGNLYILPLFIRRQQASSAADSYRIVSVDYDQEKKTWPVYPASASALEQMEAVQEMKQHAK